jgi:signal transduction histidine kinase/CheY-like chemotaxis protein
VTVAAGRVLERAVALSRSTDRDASAAALAEAVGVELILAFVRDPEVGALLPAPGFPRTIRGGPQWRAFLARCVEEGRHEACVDLPVDCMRPALGLACCGAALALVGGAPVADRVAELEQVLPLVASMLVAEHRNSIAEAAAAASREDASRANALARALDTARSHAARLNADLREQHRLKDDFLAMLAHELRNPLAPLATALELLRVRGDDTRTRERQVGTMARQVSQLSRLVDDLLDVSRVDRGRVDLRLERLDLREVLADAMEANRPLCVGRDHTCELVLPEAPIPVQGDRVRLTQVFTNLLNNAAKYTEAGGRIVTVAERAGDEAVVRIQDNGIGIAGDVLPRIFELFVQAPTALDRASGGLGVGLTLARALIRLHGGEVTAASPGRGQGSTFTVRLALAAPAAAVGEASVAPGEPSTVTPASQLEVEPAGLSILLVDDNRDAADTLDAMLEMMGHRPRVAYGGEDAVTLGAATRFDLALVDIGLPGMDGFAVAKQLRERQPRLLIVALTGYGAASDRERSRAAGFDEHLVKPLGMDDLRRLLERAGKPHLTH